MYAQLVNHNDDLRRLEEKGYAIAFDSNYLIVRDIPYLDSAMSLRIGTIVTKLVFVDRTTVRQDDHQIFFAGSVPHGLDEKPIPNLGGGQTTLTLTDACNDVVVERSFSNKPSATGCFDDFFHKIESYVSIISGPAMERHPGKNPYTFRKVEKIKSESVFKFADTLTSRAEIGDLTAKFKDDVVAVIGLGGTGSYLLDFLVKTSVREIRAFDLDPFHVHNSYRSPGHLDENELGKSKAEVYRLRYENFRDGLHVIPKFIDASCIDDLSGVTFAFVCVDKGYSRAAILELLITNNIPFIDVGMGLDRKAGGPLDGLVRTTYFSTENGRRIRDKGVVPLADQPDDAYRNNTQISELNALNACIAVIKYKQLRGFYATDAPCYNILMGISDLKIVSSSSPDED